MAREIVLWPNKMLTTATRPVTDFGPALERLLGEMLEAVQKAKGVGIAANQVGESLRLALVSRDDGTFFEIINPQILERSGKVVLEEGCLSVPEEWEKTPRFHKVKVRYQDKTQQWHEEEAEGRLAHVFQHEIDHLDGHVFVELLSGLKRGIIQERMVRYLKYLKRKKD